MLVLDNKNSLKVVFCIINEENTFIIIFITVNEMDLLNEISSKVRNYCFSLHPKCLAWCLGV